MTGFSGLLAAASMAIKPPGKTVLKFKPKIWSLELHVWKVLACGADHGVGWRRSETYLRFRAHALTGKKVSGPSGAPGANFVLFEVKLPLMVSIKFNQNTLGGRGKKL